MNKKKVLLITLITAAVILAGFACVAIIQGQNQAPSEEPPLSENKYYSQKETLPAPKIFAEGTTQEKKLTYEKTLNGSEGRTLDIYVDGSGKEYRYDESGALRGITDPSLSASKKGNGEINEADAKKLSTEYGLELYGKEFESFSFDSYGVMATGLHNVWYAKRYGEGGYIQGPTISFMLTKEGELYSSSNQNSEEYEKFDEKLQITFKKSDVETFLAQEIQKSSEEKVLSCTMDSCQLKYEEGNYYLQIFATTNYADRTYRSIHRYDF